MNKLLYYCLVLLIASNFAYMAYGAYIKDNKVPEFVCYDGTTIHCAFINKYKGNDIVSWSEGYDKSADKCTCIHTFNPEPIVK